MKTKFDQKNLFCLPWAQTILGTHLNGRANYMALDWLTRVNFKPAMLGICVNRTNASHDAIVAASEFSINVPSVGMVGVTDYVGMVSGKRIDKSDLFEVFYGELKAAPMIKECPLNIECMVVQTIELPTNSFFIAEIINIYCDDEFMTEGKPDTAKIKPFVLTMPDNRFWAIGDCIGRAWHEGKEFRRSGESDT